MRIARRVQQLHNCIGGDKNLTHFYSSTTVAEMFITIRINTRCLLASARWAAVPTASVIVAMECACDSGSMVGIRTGTARREFVTQKSKPPRDIIQKLLAMVLNIAGARGSGAFAAT